jgi:hypothetical protein
MARFVISYRAPRDYVPGRADDMSAWAAWFGGLGASLADAGNPVREVVQLGDCGASQQLRGYTVVTADDLQAALALAKECPGLADPGFGVEVGVVEELG